LAQVKKSWRIPVLVLLVSSLLCVLLGYFQPRQPAHEGKSLRRWLTQLKPRYNSQDYSINAEVYRALQAIGTNAIPVLRMELRARDSKVKARIIRLLGRQSFFLMMLAPAEVRRRNAVLACQVLGPSGSPLIPDLDDLLNRAEGRVVEAAEALASAGPEAMPILLKRLSHTNSSVRHLVFPSAPKILFARRRTLISQHEH
jgi:hypothetical protein